MKYGHKYPIILLYGLICLLLIAAPASAMTIPASDPARENATAPEKSPVISENWELERIDFIHYLKPVRTAAAASNTGGYKLLGAKLPAGQVTYYVNANGIGGGKGEIDASAQTWDAASKGVLFDSQSSSTAQYGTLDGMNAISFGTYPGSSNVIAVTSLWINKRTKLIVEFDMLFNTYYQWGIVDSPGDQFMDIRNIATHEFGHCVGLADIYRSTYSEVTMYGYAGIGETKKQTLEPQDLAGLRQLYGQ